MGTLNVKIPDEMEGDIDEYLKRNPYYMNKSELVRDSLRHMITGERKRQPDEIDRTAARWLYESASQSARRTITEHEVDESEIDDAIEWARARTERSG